MSGTKAALEIDGQKLMASLSQDVGPALGAQTGEQLVFAGRA